MSRGKQRLVGPIERLEKFNRAAERLRDSQLVRQGFLTQSVIHFDNTGQTPVMTVSLTEPADDLLTGLLGIFRQFINNSESIFMDRIFNTLHQHLTDERLRGEIVKARAHWKKILNQDGMTLIYNGTDLSPLFVVDMWINDSLHSDITEPEKEAILKYMSPIERAIMRPKFFTCIANAIRVIAYVHLVVDKALRESLLDLSRSKPSREELAV